MKGAQDRRWNPTPNRRFAWTPTWTPLATALYARTDDLLKTHPEWVPSRPKVGIAPRISDAELVTMALMQALLGFTSEARWLRHARAHRGHLFPYLPQQPGYNKRLRRLAGTLNWLTGILALDTNVWTDDVWVVDSTPIECARSRDTVKRSDLAGWAEYGYCASHSRYFWGVRLHLVATLQGLPIGFVITGAKADERQVLLDLLHDDPTLAASRPGQTLIADKNYYGRDFEHDLARRGIQLLRRARKGEPERPGGRYFKRAIRITAVQVHACQIWRGTASVNTRACASGSHTAVIQIALYFKPLRQTGESISTPSRDSSASNSTAATAARESWSASCNASSP